MYYWSFFWRNVFNSSIFSNHKEKLDFLNSQIKKEIKENGWYYLIEINSDDVINYDLKLLIKGKKLHFILGLTYGMQLLKLLVNM